MGVRTFDAYCGGCDHVHGLDADLLEQALADVDVIDMACPTEGCRGRFEFFHQVTSDGE